MPPTIHAVAEAAGVSTTTVSFVLNNRCPQIDTIPKETRDRVRACAAALGYRRNPAAAALRTGRSLWIGVMVQPLKNEWDAWMWAPYELSMLSGVQRRLSDEGYFTVVGSRSPTDDTSSLEALVSSGIGALILRAPSPREVKRARELIREGIPTVAVFPLNKQDLYPYSVDMDNVRAGQLAAELFLQAGRRKLAVIANEDCRHSETDRERGFRDVVTREQGSPPLRCLLPASYSEPARVDALARFVAEHRPDAVMATEAGNSFLTSFAVERANLRVPADLVIIGFDCYSFRSAGEQKLSAVGTSWWQAGQLAAASILDMVHQRTQWTKPKLLVPRFIPGDSTPPEMARDGDLSWLL